MMPVETLSTYFQFSNVLHQLTKQKYSYSILDVIKTSIVCRLLVQQLFKMSAICVNESWNDFWKLWMEYRIGSFGDLTFLHCQWNVIDFIIIVKDSTTEVTISLLCICTSRQYFQHSLMTQVMTYSKNMFLYASVFTFY